MRQRGKWTNDEDDNQDDNNDDDDNDEAGTDNNNEHHDDDNDLMMMTLTRVMSTTTNVTTVVTPAKLIHTSNKRIHTTKYSRQRILWRELGTNKGRNENPEKERRGRGSWCIVGTKVALLFGQIVVLMNQLIDARFFLKAIA